MQTVLTIPLTQPGSPQFPGSPQTSQFGRQSPPNGQQGQSCNSPCSPHVAPTAPNSMTPDFPGAAGPLSNPLFNIAPHLVNHHMSNHLSMVYLNS